MNDDGFEAAGIWAMRDALVQAGYEVVFVAPKRQQSWSGKSLFDHSPISYEKAVIKGQTVHIIDATPAACVRIALHDILDQPPLFVVSGINHGSNNSIKFMMSSGTLGAALEASLDGVRSLAVSLAYAPSYKEGTADLDKQFKNTAKIAASLVQKLEDYIFPAEIDALNLNVPFEAAADKVIVCKPSRESYGKLYQKDNNSMYAKILLPDQPTQGIEPNTDSHYLNLGNPTLTPISLEIASDKGLEKLRQKLNG